MNSQLDINDRELTLQAFRATGAAKLAERRAEQERAEAEALAQEQAGFETAWNVVIQVITDRWPFVAVDRPVFLKDDGSRGRLPSYSSQCEMRLRLPAELAPIGILMEQRYDEAVKDSRWRIYGQGIEVHELRATASGYSDGAYYVSTQDVAAHFYPQDFDAAIALAFELGAKRPALEAEAAQLNEAKRLRAVARLEAKARPTVAERALALVTEMVELVHKHELPE